LGDDAPRRRFGARHRLAPGVRRQRKARWLAARSIIDSMLPLPSDIAVFERGWLSSNNVLLHGGDGATLIDSSHCLHAEQTIALVRQALRPGETLATLVNTHLHSDHCGGNAAVQRAFAARIVIPPGEADAIARWDDDALSYRATGQRIERFVHDALLRPGGSLIVGARSWQVLAAPGHDPHSLILFDAQDGVLVSADALWENGFGVVFPELDGERAFDDVAAVLGVIERLAPRIVIPGHGAPFADVSAALQRARSRLAGFVADPPRHARHAAKVLLKYHLLEEQQQDLPDLLSWWSAVPLIQRLWHRLRRPAGSAAGWCEQLTHELAALGALRIDGVRVTNQ
jgi:glyoxylase-like metal-dependent hydrolase (beta-lactamase superfamily II)